MIDREKVINELTEIYDEAYARWVHCPYIEDDLVTLIKNGIPHALSFLWGQEPVKPQTVLHTGNSEDPTIQALICGNCHKIIGAIVFNYCPWCGKKVKWEEDDGKDSTKASDIQ